LEDFASVAAGAAIPDSHREPRKCANLFSASNHAKKL
jgi:hypothetical protein